MDFSRRRFIQLGAAATVGSIAGCLGSDSETLPAPTKGDPEAAITIESFEDFTCHVCRDFALEVLPQIESKYVETGTAKFVRHDYPFVDPEWAFKAANAARAVQVSQGDEAFFEFAHNLYESFGSYDLELFETLAADVGADPETVRTAAVENRYRATLEAGLELGKERGIPGTPTVFVNGVKAPSPRFTHVASTIEEQL